jgi:hypothetical protein
MEFEQEDTYRDSRGMHDKCKKCMNYHVKLTMTDGKTLDGIIESVDSDRIIILVGEDVMDDNGGGDPQYYQYQQNDPEYYQYQERQYYNYRPPMRYRRFSRQAFPLAGLAALSLLPYPYVAPPYVYYPYYY